MCVCEALVRQYGGAVRVNDCFVLGTTQPVFATTKPVFGTRHGDGVVAAASVPVDRAVLCCAVLYWRDCAGAGQAPACQADQWSLCC